MAMLPKWMRQAIEQQVLSEAEAQEMHQLTQASEEEEEELVILPEHLWPAASRVSLWEQPASLTQH